MKKLLECNNEVPVLDGKPVESFGVLEYWTNFADTAKVELNALSGWNITRTMVGKQTVLYFEHLPLGFSLEFRIKETKHGFSIELPRQGAREFSSNRLHALALLPELGEQRKGDPGHYIIPQQSGVLCSFNDKRSAEYRIGIYGGGVSECNMPLWGIAVGDTLTAGVITSGYCDAAFQLKTNYGGEHIYQLAPVFYFRYAFTFRNPDTPTVQDNIRVEYRRLKIKGDGYVELAAMYRNMLLESGRVKPLRERIKNNPILAQAIKSPEIRVRCAVKWPHPPVILEQTPKNEPELHIFCNFECIGQIVERCHQAGIKNAEFCLVGWNYRGHDGRYPQILPVEPQLGGEEKLRALLKRGKELGYLMACHDNFYDVYSVSEDWSEEYLIRNEEMYPLKDGKWGGGQAYLICPQRACELFARRNILAENNLGFTGLHFTDCLSTTGLKVCCDPNHPLTKTQAAEWRRKILETARELCGGVQCEGPLDFAVGALDRVLYIESFNASNGLSERDYADKIIPLYQIVYHGIIVYNVTTASMNACRGSDHYLRNLEYGAMPLFYFHRKFASNTSSGEALPSLTEDFLTTDDKLDEEIAEIKKAYDDFTVKSSHLQLEYITNHDYPCPGVSRTFYSNGECLWVNYNHTQMKFENMELPPRDFIISK